MLKLRNEVPGLGIGLEDHALGLGLGPVTLVLVNDADQNGRRSRTTSMPHADAPTADSSELYSKEWQMLAKIVDRIFFWLFVISSIGALGSMFASLPHKNLS